MNSLIVSTTWFRHRGDGGAALVERGHNANLQEDALIVVPCGHCGWGQGLRLERIEVNEGLAWHRCVGCEECFTVRWDDAVAIGAVAPVTIT